MESILDFFGALGESIGRSVGAFIVGMGCLMASVWLGWRLGAGLIWFMKVLHVRNYTVEAFIENHSGFFPMYLVVLWLLSLIFFNYG